MTQQEVDALSLEIEDLAGREDVDDEEILDFVLRYLPDSEFGKGRYRDTGSSREEVADGC